MPEVAGDAALLINPENTDDIRDAMARLDADAALRCRLAERGLICARQFSLEATASKFLDVWATIGRNGRK
jgi:glycosyltransferase involved in cell wall biosynthesis